MRQYSVGKATPMWKNSNFTQVISFEMAITTLEHSLVKDLRKCQLGAHHWPKSKWNDIPTMRRNRDQSRSLCNSMHLWCANTSNTASYPGTCMPPTHPQNHVTEQVREASDLPQNHTQGGKSGYRMT